MDYNKLKKEELLEIVQNLAYEKEELEKIKEKYLELKEQEKVHLNGIRVKDNKIKELRAQLEGFETKHNDIVKDIEDQTKKIIKDYQHQNNAVKQEYAVLKNTLNKVLEVNEALTELKEVQDKSFGRVLKSFNEALFEEEE